MAHDISTLRKLLRYDPETGKLFWRERPENLHLRAKGWNTKWSGREAMTAKDSNGYHQATIIGERWTAHRAAWAIYYGEMPTIIDHINGDPSDNRIANLRQVTFTKNSMNMRCRNGRANPVGVTFEKRRGKWRATIGVNGKFISLGYFIDIEDAVTARKKAEEDLGFDENHGKHASGRRP